MATSGSIDFTVTRDDVITEALEVLGVLGEGESPTSDQLTSSARTLNMLIKNLQAEGINLFAVRRQYLFLDTTTQKYSLSSTSSHHFTEDFVETTLSADSAALDSSITVASISGISDGDYIGIHTTNSVEWTTVSGSPSGSTINLADTLALAGATGNKVIAYSTRANRPMKVIEAFLHNSDNNTDIPVEIESRRNYNSLSNKAAQGYVNQIYYDPQIDTGYLYVWPVSNTACARLVLISQRTLEDVDSATDNFDIPQEWYMTLSYVLAMHLAPKYGIPKQDYEIVERQAMMLYSKAKAFDEESFTSVYFTPDFNRG